MGGGGLNKREVTRTAHQSDSAPPTVHSEVRETLDRKTQTTRLRVRYNNQFIIIAVKCKSL